MVNKKGNILVENVIFIILNLMFLSMLILFLWNQGTGDSLVEETYSKEIALLIDSAKPVMEIKLNVDILKEKAEENGFDFSKAVVVKDNFVNVKLSSEGGHKYSFFKDVDVRAFPEENELNEYTGNYIFTIN